MKILVITKLFSQPEDVGDDKPTLTVNYIVREWAAMGHEVVVIHTSTRFPVAFYLLPNSIKSRYASRLSTNFPPLASRKPLCREENGVRIYRMPMFKWINGTAYSEQAMRKQTDKIRAVLEKLHFVPELVAGHFANPATELTARLAEIYHAKSSIVFHRDAFEKNISKYHLKEWVAKLGAVGARSIGEAHELQASLNLKELPFVCCSGVPNETAAQAQTVCERHDFTGGIRYLYVGSMIPRKHLDTVIQSFSDMAGPKDTLKIVGGGPEKEQLLRLAESTGKRNQMEFAGLLSREEVFREMAKAHIMVLVSSGETFGMVYIEAMLQGCLVIASRGGAFDGIIQDGENGFLCEAGNAAELSEVCRHIAAMPETERNRIGSNAVKTALNYTEKATAERYLQDILSHQKGAAES